MLLTVAYRGQTFDATLSDALLFDAEPPKVADIARIRFYALEGQSRWPTPDEIGKATVSYESLIADEIADWVKASRTHGDGRGSTKPRHVHAMLVVMKDGRTAYFQVLTYDDVSYIIPFPAKDELGTHGFFSKSLFELLKKKGLGE